MSRTQQLNQAGGPLPPFGRITFVEDCKLRPGIATDNVLAGTYAAADAQLAKDKSTVWQVSGTNMTSALATFSAGGGWTLTTAGADGDTAVLEGSTASNVSSLADTTFSTSDSIAMWARVKTGASVANAVISIGFKLTSTTVTATDANQIFLRYEDDVNSGNWQFVTSRAGTDTTTDTGLAVAASTTYDIAIMVDADRKPKLVINEVVYAGSDNTALTASIDLLPFVVVEADGAAAAKAITVRPGITISKADND